MMVVGEFTQESELVVIGGGPGGYSAAFRAAELGVQTILVDPRGQLGGTCLHAGCIPSKTLLHMGELLRVPKRAAALGVSFGEGEPSVDLDKVREWVAGSVSTLADGLAARARKLGVEVITGRVVFEDAKNLTIHGEETNQRIKFRRAIVATGLQTGGVHPMFSAFDESLVMSAAEAVSERGLANIPKRVLVVVGTECYGIELACIYAALGSAVTVVGDGGGDGVNERELLGGVDADLLRVLVRVLMKAPGIEIALGAEVGSAVPVGMTGARVAFVGEKPPAESVFGGVIVATKGELDFGGLGLDRAGVEVDGTTGYVVVDEATLKTSNPRVFAVGDITGPPLVANRALRQGRIAGEIVAGRESSVYDVAAVPLVIFTDPQIAWCGLTEREAKAAGITHKIAKLPWGASGLAVGMGRQREGMTKIIYDAETELVLGVGIVGMGATEMIGTGVLALEMGAEIGDLAGVMFPHPTLSELLGDAAESIES